MHAIEIRHLSKSYKDFTLEDVSLTLPQGCIMGLIGENGAGKSTVIKLILNMIEKDEGTISLFGKDHQDSIHLAKEEIGVVLDEVGLPGCLTPVQIGKVMRHVFQHWDDAEYTGYLTTFDLPRHQKFKEFSRGMKMKLEIAIALSHHPKLLILDEATSGLDPVIRDEILDIFNEFTRDETHSILISSHIVSDLEKICDYIAFLHQGKLLLCAEKDMLKAEYCLIHCSAAQLAEIPSDAIQGVKKNIYGAEAIVRRDQVPADMEIHPIDIEQLFIFMAKETDIS